MNTFPRLFSAIAIAALSSTASAAIGGPDCLPEFAGQPSSHSGLPGYRPYGYGRLPYSGAGFAPGEIFPVPAPVMPAMPGIGVFPGGMGPWGGSPWSDGPFNGPFGGGPFGDFAPWGGAPWAAPYYGYAPAAPAAPAISPIEDDQAIVGSDPSTPAGPVDTDQDGVFDSADLCANTAPTDKVDGLGCSLDAPIVLEGVHFHTDSAKLTDTSITILDGVAKTLTANPDIKVEVAGHTDSDAADDYNLTLSQTRAQTVVAYLTAHGVQSERLTAKGYGESQPLVANDSPANKAINRRVELRRL